MSFGLPLRRISGGPHTETELRPRAAEAGCRRVLVADCWLDICPKHPHGAAFEVSA